MNISEVAHKAVTQWKIDEHLTLYPILERGIDAKSIPDLIKSVAQALKKALDEGYKDGTIALEVIEQLAEQRGNSLDSCSKKLYELERSILDLSHPNIKSVLEENKALREQVEKLKVQLTKAVTEDNRQMAHERWHDEMLEKSEEISALRKELEETKALLRQDVSTREQHWSIQSEVYRLENESLRHSLEIAREALESIKDGDVGQGGFDPVYSKFAREALASLSSLSKKEMK
jgi:regulator of replication initiation timing